MSSATNHPKTILLDYCWICECKFVGFGGTEIRHDHHIVPRAYGGVDGPTVTICDTHHSKTHRLAESLMHNKQKDRYQLLLGEPAPQVKKLLYLADVIRNAWLATKNDPNKLAQVTLTLNRDQQLMVTKLKAIYPKAKSRNAILDIALQSLYNKHYAD